MTRWYRVVATWGFFTAGALAFQLIGWWRMLILCAITFALAEFSVWREDRKTRDRKKGPDGI